MVKVLKGRKGHTFLANGYVYAPYIPVMIADKINIGDMVIVADTGYHDGYSGQITKRLGLVVGNFGTRAWGRMVLCFWDDIIREYYVSELKLVSTDT